jgi:DNA-binding FrmR family transcriptional regulator|tara:strand:+ start:9477 stop:9728 length:252 start_codon:yes stop_codon:yes gene_type:complete
MICNKKILNRIKRTKGQMAGIIDMMEKEKNCLEIVNQLKAVKSSIEKSIGLLTTENLLQRIDNNNQIDQKQFSEAIDIIIKGI